MMRFFIDVLIFWSGFMMASVIFALFHKPIADEFEDDETVARYVRNLNETPCNVTIREGKPDKNLTQLLEEYATMGDGPK